MRHVSIQVISGNELLVGLLAHEVKFAKDVDQVVCVIPPMVTFLACQCVVVMRFVAVAYLALTCHALYNFNIATTEPNAVHG